MQVENVLIADLKKFDRNPRQMPGRMAKALRESLDRFGIVEPLVVNRRDNTIIGGHQRLDAAEALGLKTVPVVFVDLDEADATALNIALNKIEGEWDFDTLSDLLAELDGTDFDLESLGFDEAELESLLSEAAPFSDAESVSLVERFGAPPFSILDTRQGYWQERKQQWLALGIEGEKGRGEDADGSGVLWDSVTVRDKQFYPKKLAAEKRLGRKLTTKEFIAHHYDPESMDAASANGTSIFDPVLCELAYRWFCPPDGRILDPFAGGSVRGIVAAKLGRGYTGIELRDAQVEANREQAAKIVPDKTPEWIVGDSREVLKGLNSEADFIFSCPPYFDLEVYSDDGADLSNAGDYDAFLEAYRDIIAKAAGLLKEDRFACFVVGDVRDKRGILRNFVSDTIAAFRDAGLALYNEAILINTAGSLPVRVRRQFEAGRKLGKMHQNVLVFVKGDPRRATEHCGAVEDYGIESE